jgi:hypothetical protein
VLGLGVGVRGLGVGVGVGLGLGGVVGVRSLVLSAAKYC